MSTPESQEKLKEEVRNLRKQIDALVKDKTPHDRVVRTVCIYAGMITETLLEYEEPDVVMEQAFHRVAELLATDPVEDLDREKFMPQAWTIDQDTELGRHLARGSGKKLTKGLDDIHDIAIAMIIDDVPVWEKEGFKRDVLLRLLIETVIVSLTFEMGAQDFCDMLVEDFISDGNPPGDAILGLAAMSGIYYTLAETQETLPVDAELQLTNVMVRESLRYDTPGSKNWTILAAANDLEQKDISKYMEKMKPQIDEFFELIGLEGAMNRAVAIAKAVGRMVAVVSVEDIGQIHPSIAKSLAKTGMILGSRYRVNSN